MFGFISWILNAAYAANPSSHPKNKPATKQEVDETYSGGPPDQKIIDDPYASKLYRRHYQGALVRSGVSLTMWLFCLFAFLGGVVHSHNFMGVSASVLYLILINPPTLFILRRTKLRTLYRVFSLMINLLEIIGYTAIIYFLGGIESAYLALIYGALITYAGLVAPRRTPFIVASLCSVCFAAMILADHFGLIRHQYAMPERYSYYPFSAQLVIAGVVIGWLFVVAYISYFTAGLLKRSRDEVRRQNKELETKVNERTRDLEMTNQALQEEIVERKRAQEALLESEERYRSLFDRSLYCVYLHDFEGRFLDANDSALKLLGYSREDIPTLNVASFIGEDQMPKALETLEEIRRTGSQSSLTEFRLRNRDGEHVWVETESSLIYREGEPDTIQGLALDITARKEAQEALRRSEEKYRQLVENANEGIVVTQDGKNVFFNNRIALKSPYSIDEIASKNFIEFIHPNDRESATERYTKLIGGQSVPQNYEFRIVDKHEDVRWVMSNSVLIDWEDKPAVLTFMTEITERKRLEEQYLQSQRMEAIGQLAGGVAHDFNNLLTSIMGYAELMLIQLAVDNPLRGNVEQIKKAGDRAASLTGQLLAFSRKQILQPKVLNLNDVVTDLKKMLGRLIGEDIELETILGPHVWKVNADPAKMEQVIMNLAVNARDAMPEGGKLTMETANVHLDEAYAKEHDVTMKPGHYVMLAIADSGTGIDKETASRMFEPFFTTKELGKGTGLGLATVYGIIKQSDGFIWVYSELDHGTTFKIYLPRGEEEEAPDKRRQPPLESLKGIETVLVVEDDAMVRTLTVSFLKGFDYNVLEAETPEEALEICRRYGGPLHLMLTDVVMPGMSGRKLAEKIVTVRPELKVLYMSGYTANAIVHHGVLDPDVNFIQKPFTMEGLAGKVRQILDETEG